MTRVLVLGGAGQVGSAVIQLARPGVVITAPSSAELNLNSESMLRAAVQDLSPEVIINCAAFTRVDDAELNTDAAFAVNAEAPRILAEAAQVVGARFIHVSTDYVFDGISNAPYATGAHTNPQSVYGASKLKGEQAVTAANVNAATVRTAWVHSGGGTNFLATALRIFQQGKVMHVVDDQVSTPTRALHLAAALWSLVARPQLRGVFHFTDAGVASWYDVAQCVLDTMQREGVRELSAAVVPVSTAAFPRPAQRPAISILDKHSSWNALEIVPQHWRVGVAASTRELIHA